MGRFSTTVHIKNNVDRMRFVNTFSEVMEKRGFVPCTEDEAAVSYLLAFGEGWVTLANEDYKNGSQKSHEDIREMSKALKTSAFLVEVVDSDFAIMALCAPNCTGNQITIGDGSGYGVPEIKVDRKLWEPLLADGKTWEQFSEAAATQDVFVEDTLGKVASVLGIDPYYINAGHDEVSAKADGNNNITVLYFKGIATIDKSMSLNAAFKKVFGEALEPLGFKLIKSKFPYFVRVVPGGEIIHVITFKSRQGTMQNEKAFEICGGVATVYRGKINLNINPRNTNWLLGIFYAYSDLHPLEDDMALRKKLLSFEYVKDDQHSMIEELVTALGYTKKFLLPVIDKVTTLSECADYYWKFHPMIMWIDYDKDWGMSKDFGESEGLMQFMIYDTKTYENKRMERIRNYKAEMQYLIKMGRTEYTSELLEDECKKKEERAKNIIAVFDKHFNDPQLNKEIHNELERRKKENTEILRSYGLVI